MAKRRNSSLEQRNEAINHIFWNQGQEFSQIFITFAD